MKKASIISIGNEIMTGQIVDTNAAYLSAKLVEAGVSTVGVFQVGDDIDTIAKTMAYGAAASDIILITGGLGPTDDDLTRQAIAQFMGTELELRDDLLGVIGEMFRRRGIPMPEMNKIQACIPRGAEPIENPTGTAPGVMAHFNGKFIAAMPGVPSEMKVMFERTVAEEIKKIVGGQTIVVRKLRCFGMGESHIAEMLGTIMVRGRNPQINITVHFGVVTLHIIALAMTRNEAEAMAAKDEKYLRMILGDLVFGMGEETIAEVVGRKLAQAGKTVATAESCTGGTVAKLITDISGSSKYFTYGWVTYANEAKTSELGVPAEVIAAHGAVSEEVARAMAIGARQRANTDFAISITGIAGPEGGSEAKPVGLVYIGIASKTNSWVEKFVFPHTREFMRLRSAQTALNLLRLKMQV